MVLRATYKLRDEADDGEPYFLKSPTNISVVEGEMAVLKCIISNLGPKMIVMAMCHQTSKF
ncbi:hypothetical protein MAR_025211 [Mya arenaria]|uniref:Uncharacterized protein n=1 Tax=Mya arenaria TaxID=6604 RepID=A0ABY7DVB5_MYAAR|nr:hypothetical protein MAR_025211 [Mya arenaria]